MAPDPHDEGDFECPDTRSLMDEFMAKMAQSVNDDYKNLHALLATLPHPSVDTGTHLVFSWTFYAWTVMRSLLQQCVPLHSALHAGAP